MWYPPVLSVSQAAEYITGDPGGPGSSDAHVRANRRCGFSPKRKISGSCLAIQVLICSMTFSGRGGVGGGIGGDTDLDIPKSANRSS